MLPAGRRATRTDGGISLVELILAVALLGTAAVTLLGAFGTLIKTSDQSRKSGDLSTTLGSAAEFVIDNSRTAYVNCTDGTPYNDGLTAFVRPATIQSITVDSVQFWDGEAGAFGAACNDSKPFWRLQLLALTLTTTSGERRTINVVKRG